MKNIHLLSCFLLTTIILIFSCANKNTSDKQSNVMELKENTNQEKYSKENTRRFNIDTKNTIIEWYGKKTTGAHNGNIQMEKGALILNKDGEIVSGKFMIDMNSINCTDLNGNKKQSIEEHLKDDDFFGTDKHPTASFIIKAADADRIYGTLTIKGISKQIDFPYSKINKHQYKAEIKIDRTLFDIKYKSKTIFPELGDNFIHDDFIIKLNPLSITK